MSNNKKKGLIVGITGQSGVGKSYISSMMSDVYGFVHLCIDDIAKITINSSLECKNVIKNTFGENSINESGKINRKYLSNKVFKSSDELRKLSNITNKYVLSATKLQITKLQNINSNINIIIDGAILFESKMSELCDFTITVTASRQNQIFRIISRDKISLTFATDRLNSQFNENFYKSRAKYILDGNKSYEYINKKIRKILTLENFNVESYKM